MRLAALDKSDFDDVLRTILQTDREELGIQRVSCWQLEDDGSAIRCLAGCGADEAGRETLITIRASEFPAYFRALSDNPIILAADARADLRTREMVDAYLVPLGITSMMDVPVWVQGRLWGVVCHERGGPPRPWSDAERDFALSIGHIVSMSVEARERAAAERTVRSSEFFIGILSHDLRSPLSVIKTSSEYLLKQPAEDARQAAVQRILRTTDQMTRMCEQLLDFTRIRIGGGLPVRCRQTDLAALVHRVAMEAETSRPGSQLDVQVAGDAAGHWDPDRLWQLLSNLVGNALTHGAPGGRVWARVNGQQPDVVILQVGNLGVVPPALQASIFEPFQCASHSEASQVAAPAGLGLGLFIARGIVNAHGGTITIEARHGETIVQVVLPRRRVWGEVVPTASAMAPEDSAPAR